jgi:hypothetical protein
MTYFDGWLASAICSDIFFVVEEVLLSNKAVLFYILHGT